MIGTFNKAMYQAKAEIVLKGDTLEPRDITAQVGLEPTRAWPNGLRYASRSGRELKKATGLWAFGYEGAEVPPLVAALLASVEPRLDAIRRTIQSGGLEIAISIWWEPVAVEAEFDIECLLLTRLAAIAPVWSFYYPGVQLTAGSKALSSSSGVGGPATANGALDEAANRATVEILFVHASSDLAKMKPHTDSDIVNSKEVMDTDTAPHACIGNGEKVADAVRSFLLRVEPQIDAIRALARSRNAGIVIRICWAPADGYGGYGLESTDMVRLSALCERLSFYFRGMIY